MLLQRLFFRFLVNLGKSQTLNSLTLVIKKEEMFQSRYPLRRFYKVLYSHFFLKFLSFIFSGCRIYSILFLSLLSLMDSTYKRERVTILSKLFKSK